MAEHILHKSGAVCTGMRIIAAPDIASSYELQCIIDNLATQGIALVGLFF